MLACGAEGNPGRGNKTAELLALTQDASAGEHPLVHAHEVGTSLVVSCCHGENLSGHLGGFQVVRRLGYHDIHELEGPEWRQGEDGK